MDDVSRRTIAMVIDGCDQVPDALRRRYLARGQWDGTSLGDLLLNDLRRHPGQHVRLWFNHVERQETFASLESAARRFASGLSRCGVTPGDPVVVWLPNGWEALVAFVGAAALGAVVVPMASFYGRKDLVATVNASGAHIVITQMRHGHRGYLDEIGDSRGEMSTLKTVVVCGSGGMSMPGAGLISFEDLMTAVPIRSSSRPVDQPCLLAFTSGTSGTAKGVVHAHRTLCAEVRHHLTSMIPPNLAPQIMASPITHAAGMTLGLLAPIHRGEPIHLVDTFDADFILDTAESEGLAPGGGAAVFLSALIDHPKFTDEIAQRMGYVILGGSTVPESLVFKAAARGITVLRSYGLTEHPTVSAGRLGDSSADLASTDGHLLDGVEVQVRNHLGAVLPAGVEGELFTRGPDRCAGYLEPELNTAFDDEGWLATGDIGVLTADDRLTITARSKDLIIRNGVNISPAEVESALLNCPAVADVAVIGVPDRRTGERAVAVVVPQHCDEATLNTLTAHLASAGVAKPKWPEELHLVGELPRTASGKVRKNELRRAFT